MAHPYPLRYSLPLGFLLIGLAMIGLGYGFNHADIRRRNETLIRQRAFELGALVAPELREELVTRDARAGGKTMERLRVVPHLTLAVLCNNFGRVALTTQPDFTGRPIAEVSPLLEPLIAEARRTHAPQFEFSSDRDRLWAVFAVDAAPGAGNYWLCTESNVAAQQAPAYASLKRRTATLAALAFAICAGVWYYFSRTITRRAMALVRITEAFAAGRFGPPLPTRGSDELAKLNAAFNKMARDIRARDVAIRDREERLAQAIDASELGTWDWNLATDACIDNDRWWRMFGYAPGELPARGAVWRELCHPEDWPAVTAAIDAHFSGRTAHYECEHRMRHKSGRWIWVVDKGLLIERDAQGRPFRAIGTTRDITARKETDAMLAAQQALLEGIAKGEPLADSLAAICRFAEVRGTGMLASILVLDRTGRHLRHGAAPSLPAEYCRAIDGVEIGPAVGSCGTAAYRHAQVIVSDISVDPLWQNFRDLAARHSLRACWSTPITGPDGILLGTFAIYYREPRAPGAEHEQIIRIATHTASLALHRARTAAHLQASEERFGRAFGASPVPMIVTTLAQGRIIDANDAFARTIGFSDKHEPIGRTVVELNLWHDPADRERMLALLSSGRPLTDVEAKFRRRNGEVGDALASVEIIQIDDELCCLTLLHDITARKRTEERLRLAERETEHHLALLQATLDGLDEGVMVFDLAGRAYYWNHAALRLHGYTDLAECRALAADFPLTHELRDQTGATLPPGQWPLACILRGEVLRDRELLIHHRVQGWQRWFAYSGTLVRDSAGQILLAVVSLSDTTARRQLEEQFRQSQKMEAVGQLAGGMAHDFNNILTAIIVRSELAALQPDHSTESGAAFTEIKDLGLRAAGLTKQLLAFSRRSVMDRRILNLSDIATTDAKMLVRLLGEDIRLELVLHSRALPIFADEGMIGQILLNLAVNARDAMPRGGRLTLETCERSLTGQEPGLPPDVPPGSYACLRFADTGTGIAPENLPRIFEPFFTTKGLGKGTGLGLATVFGIVRQHEGWITVESPPGSGAVFSVFLPFARGEVLAPDATPAAQLPCGTETILLVEDEEAVRVSTTRLLTRQGYQVLSASHGPEARVIWLRDSARIDLLFTDIVMPENISGYELAAEFQTERPDLPVILATGYSPQIAGRDLILGPRQLLLQKPFDATQLLATVRAALDSR